MDVQVARKEIIEKSLTPDMSQELDYTNWAEKVVVYLLNNEFVSFMALIAVGGFYFDLLTGCLIVIVVVFMVVYFFLLAWLYCVFLLFILLSLFFFCFFVSPFANIWDFLCSSSCRPCRLNVDAITKTCNTLSADGGIFGL